MTHDGFYAGLRSEHSRCDSTSSLLSFLFFPLSLQTHRCFLTSIFPETEEVGDPKLIYTTGSTKAQTALVPSGGGEGYGTQPHLQVRRAERQPSLQVGGGVYGSLFLKALFRPRRRSHPGPPRAWQEPVGVETERPSMPDRLSLAPPLVLSIRCSAPITDSRRRRLDGSYSSIPTSPMRRFDERERFKQEQIRLIIADLKKSAKRQERRCGVAGEKRPIYAKYVEPDSEY